MMTFSNQMEDRMSVLNGLRLRILSAVGKEKCSRYVAFAMQWLGNEISLEQFDDQGQSLIGVHLHSEFLLKISELLEVITLALCNMPVKIGLDNQKAIRDNGNVATADSSPVAIFVSRVTTSPFSANASVQSPTTSSRVIPVADYSKVPGITEAVALSLSGYLPHRDAVIARCVLHGWQHGIEEISADVAIVITRSVRVGLSFLVSTMERIFLGSRCESARGTLASYEAIHIKRLRSHAFIRCPETQCVGRCQISDIHCPATATY